MSFFSISFKTGWCNRLVLMLMRPLALLSKALLAAGFIGALGFWPATVFFPIEVRMSGEMGVASQLGGCHVPHCCCS